MKNNEDDHQQRIFLEQIRSLYAKNPTVLAGTLGISLAALIVLWRVIETHYLLAWFSATLLITAGRAYLGYRFNPDALHSSNAYFWANAFVVGAIINALSWSIVPYFFLLPEQPLYVLFIVCLYAGYISGSVASTSVYFPAFLGFALPVTLIFSIRVFMESNPIYFAIGVMIWFYAAASYSFARNNERTIADAIALKFENTDLLEELREQRDAAERAVNAKNHFLAATSHDLRQPLHALGLFVEAMESEVGEQKSSDTLAKIRESTEALTTQLHAMMDLSTLDANIVEYKPRHFSLSPLMSRMTNEFGAQAASKNLGFTIAETELTVFCDEQILQRILGNLLSNAVSHTQTGSVSVELTETPDEKIEICVRDTGPGIPQSEFENIFTEYRQLSNPGRDRRHGLGLGLAIVKRLCALGQLNLDLQSTLGAGSTFTLQVPNGRASNIEDASPLSPIGSLEGVRVVVIDDDRDVIAGTCEMLERWGCETIGALNAQEAINKLTNAGELPDVLISDFRLADKETGLDAIERFETTFEETLRYLIITGETMPSELRAVNEAGIAILHKPVRPGELRSALHHLLGESGP